MAAGLREIKRRLKSVRSTMQITKAMEMVAAARLKRAQARVMHMRENVSILQWNMNRMAFLLPEEKKLSQFFAPAPDTEKQCALMVFSADRGLCGSYNANMMKFMQHQLVRFKDEGKALHLFASGKKIYNFLLKNKNDESLVFFPLPLRPSYKDLKLNMKDLLSRYKNGEFGSLSCVYTKFISTTKHEVIEEKLLPFEEPEGETSERIIVEPDAQALLPELLTYILYAKLYLCYAEAYASEQASRMLAMRNANDSAAEMIDSLTLSYNKARQSGITKEILEVVSGAEALKG